MKEVSLLIMFSEASNGMLEMTLHWNQESLTMLIQSGTPPSPGFYPSLYLNMEKSHHYCGNLRMPEDFMHWPPIEWTVSRRVQMAISFAVVL